jgi:thioredoxin-related protein
MFRPCLAEILFIVLFLSGCNVHGGTPGAVVGAMDFNAAGNEARDRLPAAVDLQADAQFARTQRLPIVLFFHSTACPFCREVEDLYLTRLQKENEKAPRFLLRTVEIGQTRPLAAFDGTRTDHRAFAKRQGVTLVPHLRFLGPDGKPLAPDLVGLTTRDFYGAYLEDSISLAGEKLHRTGR